MTTPHNQLTGSDLHEPKGIASATSGQIYIANGAGSGVWTTPDAAGYTPILKTSTESRSSTTTFAADGVLFFPVAANSKYLIRACISIGALAAPDFKYRWNGPATISAFVGQEILVDGSSNITGRYRSSVTFPTGQNTLTNAADTFYTLVLTASLQTSGSSGTFSFEWAQNSSDATASEVYRGSFMEYMDIT